MRIMNQSGQGYDVLHLLISAILGFAILLIIMGAINYMNTLREDISQKKLYDGLQSSVKSPNGDVIKIDNLVLKKGVYNTRNFSNNMGIEPECIELDAISSTVLDFEDTSITVKESLLMDVYGQCFIEGLSDCQIRCIISFGRELLPEN